MVTANELNQLNIDNLTSLWKKMGIQTQPGCAINGLTISQTWPHRYWFDWNESTEKIAAIKSLLPHLPPAAVVPVWEGVSAPATQLEKLLIDHNFQILFSQLAMYLDLQKAALVENFDTDIVEVKSTSEIEIWTATASAAFGYWIDIAAIQSIADLPEVKLLLMNHEGQAAATALVYQTGKIAGVHLVGVKDEYRGQGLARKIMHYVIKLSVEMDCKFLTLQASAAGEPLYRQLGFNSQFDIKNYKRF